MWGGGGGIMGWARPIFFREKGWAKTEFLDDWGWVIVCFVKNTLTTIHVDDLNKF